MKDFLLDRLVGNRWRTFAGIPYEEFNRNVCDVLNRMDWSVEHSSFSPTSGEATVYGSNEGAKYDVTDHSFRIRCISVSMDPVMRGALSFASSQETIDKYTDSITIIAISPINQDTKAEVRKFITNLVDEADTLPWTFNHPRFTHAILLRYKVKWLWKYWL